jgi:hypothetical protein
MLPMKHSTCGSRERASGCAAPFEIASAEAASAGLYDSGGGKVPGLQILTAAQVIDGKRPQVPFGHTESLKKASIEREDKQGRLL